MDINELYQELIIDHGTEPRNHGCLAHATHDAEGFNPLCGDKVHVYLDIADETMRELRFESHGCAISTASASIMSETLKGKNLSEVERVFEQFIQMLTTEDTPSDMGKLAALANVRRYPSRVKCATLAWHTMHNALHKVENS